jgi:flavin-dependent dehydrogenase
VESEYDVVVVGAGPAGAATARLLAQHGCRVVLLERSHFESPRVGESLAPGVQPLLADLGLWQQFLDLQPLPSYGTRSAWGAALPNEHSHLLSPYLSGWHVERSSFDRMLAESAGQAGAQLLLNTRMIHCSTQTNGGVLLQVADGADSHENFELRAGFVVDASGRPAALARSFGARRIVFDHLVGVAAQFEDPRAGSACYTLIETTADGWWYSAPVNPDHSVAMLMTDGDLSNVRQMRKLAHWRAALKQTALTSARLDGAKIRWGPRVFSAVSQRLIRPPTGSNRWLAVGDATLAVDPISGSGVIRALRTAQDAAATIIAVLLGNAQALDAYEDRRNKECTAYLFERLAYYNIEQRWPDAPFWRRREASKSLIGG